MKKILSLFAAIFVAVSMWGYTYTKVTAAPTDWSGEYIIAAELFDNQGNESTVIWTGVDAGQCRETAVFNNEGKIVNDNLITVTVSQLAEGGYSIKVNGGTNDGKYISSGTSAPTYSNGLKFNDTAHRIDFAMDANNYVQMSQTIGTSGTMYLLFNKSIGATNERFRFYKNTNLGGSNYVTPVLYKKDVAAGIAVTGVTLNTSSALLNVGEHTTLTATIAPANADDKTVSWTSSNEAVATVSNTGVVTGVGAGSATITVTTTDGSFTATCNVTVTAVAVTGVTLDKTSASIMAGETTELVATVAPANAANKNVTWTSSNDAIATVANGVVTAVAAGTATITATTIDGGFTATCNVTVTAFVEPDEIEIVFAANSSNSDSGSALTTFSTISDVFSAGSRYVSEITAVEKVYPARNSLVDGVKFGSSSAAGSITITLAKTFNVSKIVVTAAPYGDSEGRQGFILNGQTVAMTDGVNKVYADYDVNITGEVSTITLAQKTASSGRIYVKSIKLVKAGPTSEQVTINATAGYASYACAQNFTVEGAEAFKGHLDGTTLTLTPLTGIIPAAEGVILKKIGGGDATITFTEEAATADVSGNDFFGTLTEVTAASIEAEWENAFVCTTLGLKNGEVGFRKPAGGVIAANRAYLLVDASASAAPIRIIEATDTVTAVENVETLETVKFMENGQLFIKKNGVIYNAMGQVVK